MSGCVKDLRCGAGRGARGGRSGVGGGVGARQPWVPPRQDLPLVSIPAVLVDRYTPLSKRAAMYGDAPSAGRIAMGIPGFSSFSSR